MADKVLISELTWRSLEMQRQAFPNMPHYVAPDDVATMLRKSTRSDDLHIHVMSLAVIADNEKDFRDFLKLMKERKAYLHADCPIGFYIYVCQWSVDNAVDCWRRARRNGAAKAGGDAKAENSERKFWEGFAKIKDRWHLKDTSKALMKEADIGHHDTVRVNLGYTRWEWRRLSDTKRERVLKQKEKEMHNAKR